MDETRITQWCSIAFPNLHYNHPLIQSHQGSISAITDLSFNSGCWWIRDSLSLGPRRRRVFYLTIYSAILARKNPHISKYSLFSLNMRYKAIYGVGDNVSDTGIPYDDNKKGVKLCLQSI